MTQDIYTVNPPRALPVIPPRGGLFLVPTLFPRKGIRVINHLIDWLSSYPKHDLKNEMKFAIYLLCGDVLIKASMAL